MELLRNPYILAMLLTTAVALGIARLAWTKRSSRGSKAFTLLALALALWTFGYAIEFGTSSLAAKTFWALFQYIGIATVPVFWMLFVIRYTRRQEWFNKRNIFLLSIIPATTLVVCLTSPDLILSETQIRTLGGHQILERVQFGWYFWAVHSAYSYSLMLLGIILLIRSVITAPHQYRGQIASLVSAFTIGILGNFIYLIGLTPLPYLDTTPFTFLLAMLALSWGIFRGKLFDIVPIAYNHVLQNMHDIVMITNDRWCILDVNESVQQIASMNKSELMGKSVFEIFKDWPALLELCRDNAAAEIPAEIDGQQLIFETSVNRIDSNGDFLGWLILLRDISERKLFEKQLQTSHQRLELALDGADMGLWDWQLDSQEVYINQRWAGIMGYDHLELNDGNWLGSIHPDHHAKIKDAIYAHLNGQTDSIDLELKIRTLGDKWKWTLVRGRIAERDAAGNPVRVSGTMLDINDLKSAQEELLRQSRIDYLTEVYNRRYFFTRVRESMHYISRKGTVSALAILDIDHFKIINDTYGHQAGDMVLKTFAGQLRDSLRMYDILARYGGEEFIFFFFDTTRDQALIIMERIRNSMQETIIQHEGNQISFTFSAGIADTSEIREMQPESLIAIADKRLYSAKESGRDQVVI